MSKRWHNLFKMTRRERVGTWLVIVVIAALLVAFYAVRHQRSAAPPGVLNAKEEIFLRSIDSTDAVVETPTKHSAGRRDGYHDKKPTKQSKKSDKRNNTNPSAEHSNHNDIVPHIE